MQVADTGCAPQAMREVADAIHAAARGVAIFDRRRKQDEAGRLQGAWLRWELSTFDYLMRVRFCHLKCRSNG